MNNKRMGKIILAVLLLLLAILFAFSFQKKTVIFPIVIKQPIEPILAESVNGLQVVKALAMAVPLAVVVENYPAARPQSGISEADLVYETLTEGGITRFLAIYQTVNSKNIGPVRSARSYFADLADELGAVFVHVGGNSDVLLNIKAGLYPHIFDADQFFDSTYFHRISQRPAPHNVYTSVEKIKYLALSHNYQNLATYQAWQFKNDQPATSTKALNINISFSLSDYAVRWQYNPPDNNYLRFIAGMADKDADNSRQISVKNVIVQYVKTWPVLTDTIGAISMDLTMGGTAMVFLDGKTAELATWKKVNGRTRYYDKNSVEIFFNRGQTWVELVPTEKKIVWN